MFIRANGIAVFFFHMNHARAGQYVGIYCTYAISLKYWDAISEKHIKTKYRDTLTLQKNCKYHIIFREEHLKSIKWHQTLRK